MAHLDLTSLLSIHDPDNYGAMTCVGYAPSMGGRCHNPNSAADRSQATRLLRNLSLSCQTLTRRALDIELRQLAKILLCRHVHVKQQWQFDRIVDEWHDIIQQAINNRATGLPTPPASPALTTPRPQVSEIQEELVRIRTLFVETSTRLLAANADRDRLSRQINDLTGQQGVSQQRITQAETRLEQQRTAYEARIRQSETQHEARHLETRTNLERDIQNQRHDFTQRIFQLQNELQLEKERHNREMKDTKEQYNLDSILEQTLIFREESQLELDPPESIQESDSDSTTSPKWRFSMFTQFELSRQSPYLKVSLSRCPKPQDVDSADSSVTSYSPFPSVGSDRSTPSSLFAFVNATTISLSPPKFNTLNANFIISNVQHKLSPMKDSVVNLRSRFSATMAQTRATFLRNASRTSESAEEAVMSVEEMA